MKAIILAAGYGTRLAESAQECDDKKLKELLAKTPKPLLPVKGRPLVEHTIEQLLKIGSVDEIIIVTNAKYFGQFEKWKKGFECGVEIKIINDGTTSNETRLGAIKDIDLAISLENINDTLLVIAGDNYVTFDINNFADFFRKKKSTVMAVRDVGDKTTAKKRFGVVEVNEENKIIGFEEKPEEPKTSLAATAVYIIRRDHVKLVQIYNEENLEQDAPGFFLQWLHKKVDVYAWKFPAGQYTDIGNLESYRSVI